MDFSGQRICVTGASGFLGSHLVEELLAQGAEVIAFDRVPNPEMARTNRGNSRFGFVLGDIQTMQKSLDWFERCNIVIHLAGIAIPRVCNNDPDLAFQVNVEGTKEILRRAIKAERFVFASTGMVYGSQNEIPIRETAATFASDVYALTKLIGEDLCKIYHHRYGLPFTILRFGNSYGPNQSPDYLIPSIIRQAMEEKKIEVWDARPIRDFIYVNDTVEGIMSSLRTEVTANETLNIGTGRGCSTKEIAIIISRFLGVPWVEVNKKLDVPAKLVLDISKMRSLTGWSPRFSHEQGLKQTLADYVKRRSDNSTKGSSLDDHEEEEESVSR